MVEEEREVGPRCDVVDVEGVVVGLFVDEGRAEL